MARIAFILLCHKDPAGVIAQAEKFTSAGDFIAIHFDRRAGAASYNQIRTALAAMSIGIGDQFFGLWDRDCSEQVRENRL